MRPDREDSPASFRDPSGTVFVQDGVTYRAIHRSYRASYDLLMASGLYQRLVDRGLLVSHQEVEPSSAADSRTYKVIRPERVPFISYPYEWSFSQLKDAALATLRVQRLALDSGLSLKDASAFNIQFLQGRPVLIDTLSFERYDEGSPWVAYRQYCQHFLAPLAVMGYRDIRLGKLLQAYLDGLPLDLATSLLPRRSMLKFALLLNLHLHARSQRRHASAPAGAEASRRRLGKRGLLGLLDSLESGVRGLRWTPLGTEWADYYVGDSYQRAALDQKMSLVRSFMTDARPGTVWDLGANTGLFSEIAAETGAQVVAFDLDPAAVERNYLACKERQEARVLPLVMDLTNPSPALGWAHAERMSMTERGPADMVLALALVHHLAIANNLPLDRIAAFFARLAPRLAVEFVPKADPKVRQLLASRQDIFPDYTQEGFEAAFTTHYTVEAALPLRDSHRILYSLRSRR